MLVKSHFSASTLLSSDHGLSREQLKSFPSQAYFYVKGNSRIFLHLVQ
ncbi:hypothetical protein NMG60_11031543 [Bertholletia excelsa]